MAMAWSSLGVLPLPGNWEFQDRSSEQLRQDLSAVQVEGGALALRIEERAIIFRVEIDPDTRLHDGWIESHPIPTVQTEVSAAMLTLQEQRELLECLLERPELLALEPLRGRWVT